MREWEKRREVLKMVNLRLKSDVLGFVHSRDENENIDYFVCGAL